MFSLERVSDHREFCLGRFHCIYVYNVNSYMYICRRMYMMHVHNLSSQLITSYCWDYTVSKCGTTDTAGK